VELRAHKLLAKESEEKVVRGADVEVEEVGEETEEGANHANHVNQGTIPGIWLRCKYDRRMRYDCIAWRRRL
jgi:hypothetical protein